MDQHGNINTTTEHDEMVGNIQDRIDRLTEYTPILQGDYRHAHAKSGLQQSPGIQQHRVRKLKRKINCLYSSVIILALFCVLLIVLLIINIIVPAPTLPTGATVFPAEMCTPSSPQPLQNVSAPWVPEVQAIYARPWLQLAAPLTDAAYSSSSRVAPAPARSRRPVPVAVAARSRLRSGADDATDPPAAGVESFTLAAYNVLSDVAVNTSIEGYLPIPPFLRYNPFRWTRILHELVTYDAPDVLLMQEVETEVFEGPMRHSLERLGYGVALAIEQNWQKEALAYRLARFRLVTQRSFLMHELIEKALRRWLNTAPDADRNLINGLLPQLLSSVRVKPYTPQLAHLEYLPSSSALRGVQHLFVANLHLSFNMPERHALSIVQMVSVLYEMRDLLESDLQPSARGRVGLVVAGDLNHQPDSPLYELLQDGRLHTPSAIEGAHGAADMFNDSNGVAHHLIDVLSNYVKGSPYLPLKSVYKTVFGAEPNITTRAGHIYPAATFDYIWHSPAAAGGALALDAVLPTPSDAVILHERGLPSSLFPSDHLVLAARLRWTPEQPSSPTLSPTLSPTPGTTKGPGGGGVGVAGVGPNATLIALALLAVLTSMLLVFV